MLSATLLMSLSSRRSRSVSFFPVRWRQAFALVLRIGGQGGQWKEIPEKTWLGLDFCPSCSYIVLIVDGAQPSARCLTLWIRISDGLPPECRNLPRCPPAGRRALVNFLHMGMH